MSNISQKVRRISIDKSQKIKQAINRQEEEELEIVEPVKQVSHIDPIVEEFKALQDEIHVLNSKMAEILLMPQARIKKIGTPTLSGNGGTAFIDSGGYFYFGNEYSDGSWRMSVSGTDLIVERRESGTWTTKGSFTA